MKFLFLLVPLLFCFGCEPTPASSAPEAAASPTEKSPKKAPVGPDFKSVQYLYYISDRGAGFDIYRMDPTTKE